MPWGSARSRGRATSSFPGATSPDRLTDEARSRAPTGGAAVTLIWLVVWLVANYTGGHEPLLTDPVNFWT